MSILYIFCLVPIFIGFCIFLWSNYKGTGTICWKEWLMGSACAFLIAAPIHYWSYSSQVGDYETWSGKIVKAVYIPKWHEFYEYAVYRTEYYTTTDSNGKTTTHSQQVFDHWEPTSRWHSPSWTAYSDIHTNYNISESRYKYFVEQFGNESAYPGIRHSSEHNSRMISGDPNDHHTQLLNSNFVEPITDSRWFENRIRATPSVFNFVEVPENIQVFEYPENRNPWKSNRIVGSAKKDISIRLWDEMCARLGKLKRVNMILVKFDSSDTMLTEWQRSKWIGGKKNDLVICVGEGFVKVFGWSESDICKKNIELLFLHHPINNDILPLLEREVMNNYTKREFTEDFSYLSVEPTESHWLTFMILMVLSQGGLYLTFHRKELFA